MDRDDTLNIHLLSDDISTLEIGTKINPRRLCVVHTYHEIMHPIESLRLIVEA